jgi:Zn-dependent protease with chaperone function
VKHALNFVHILEEQFPPTRAVSLYLEQLEVPSSRARAIYQRTLARVASGYPRAGNVRLELRSCPGIGANALALPDGAVVVTDDLVRLSAKREQLAAVMAHEVGHIVHKHPMRMAIQAAGLAALIGTLASDAVSITGLAVALPTLLLETGYSRGFEQEADDFAFARMKALGISPAHFADILERLEASHGQRVDVNEPKKRSESAPGDYFSTHPATTSRAQRAREASR